MLQIQGISKSYGKQNVLQNFNLDVDNGEIISVVGSSGSGKTTALINLLTDRRFYGRRPWERIYW